MIKPTNWKKYLTGPAILLLYSAITIAFTAPAIKHISEQIMGDGPHPLDWSWNFWWFKKALFSPSLSVFYTDILFWPQGTDLSFNTFSLINCILYIPLSFFMNTVTAYNVLQIFTFISAAFGAYLLCFHLTQSRPASIFAGLAFSFSSYHTIHSFYHMNISTIQWMPFLALFFIKTATEKKWSNPFLAALFALINALSCWHHLVFSMLFIPILWLGMLGTENRKNLLSKDSLTRMAVFIVISGTGVLIAIWPMLSRYKINGAMVQNDISLWYSMDPFSFLFPHKFNWFLRRFNLADFYGRHFSYQISHCLYAGITVIGLCLWGWRHKSARPWLTTAAVFYVLALGPYLRIFGRWYLTWTDFHLLRITSDFLRGIFGNIAGFDFRRYAIPLPSMAFQHLPLFNVMRTPYRFALIISLSTAMISGAGLSILLSRIKKHWPQNM
jgi:hypothetical protein